MCIRQTENLISMETKFKITLLITAIVILFHANCLAAFPMWIWTEGCMKDDSSSKDPITLTSNLPTTCFRACGEDSTRVALLGNFCKCNFRFNESRQTASHFCNPCEHNGMVDCGNNNKRYWSVYRKGTRLNTSGCVIHSKKSFRIDNCSRTEVPSLCLRLTFKNEPKCNGRVGRWSLHGCDITSDRLLSSFDVSKINFLCNQKETWIGLFSLQESSVLDSSIAATGTIEFPTYGFNPTSKLFPNSEFLQTKRNIKTYIQRESLISVFPSKNITLSNTVLSTASSDNISILVTSVTYSMGTESKYLPRMNFYLQSVTNEIVYTDDLISYPRTSFHISQTEYSPSKISMTSNHLLTSSTSVSQVHGDHFASFMTKPLSSVPVFSQSVTFTKHWQSLSATSVTQSFVNEDKTAVLSPSSSLPVTTKTTETLKQNTKQKPSVKTTTETIGEASQVLDQSSNEYSRTDLLIVICVVAAVAVFALLTVGFMVVYIRRSLRRMRMKLNTTTFTGDHSSDKIIENLSQNSCNNNIQESNTSIALADSSFSLRGNRSYNNSSCNTSYLLYDGRTARVVNEYTLYKPH